jgi:hypothetical protein
MGLGVKIMGVLLDINVQNVTYLMMKAAFLHARQKQIVIKVVPDLVVGRRARAMPIVLLAHPAPQVENTMVLIFAMLLPAFVPLPKHAIMDIMEIMIIPIPVRHVRIRNHPMRLIMELPKQIIVLGRQQSQQENIMNLAQKVSRTALSVNIALVAQTSIAALPQILE